MSRFQLIPAVSILLVRDQKVLLIKRSLNSEYGPGLYNLPGGHVEANETIRQAGVRELYEETGIQLPVEGLEFIHLLHRRGRFGDYLASFFVAHIWPGEPILNEPEKQIDMQWFSLDTIPENMIGGQRHALRRWVQGYSYSEYGWVAEQED